MDTDLAQALQTIEAKLTAVNEELAPEERKAADLREELAPLESRIATLQQQRDSLAAAAVNLHSVLQALQAGSPVGASLPQGSENGQPGLPLVEGRQPNGDAADHTPRPRAVDGVVKILADLGGSGTLKDIRREFQERGWSASFKKPEAALYAATKRLAENGRLERLGEGRYRLLPEQRNGEVQEAGM
ncbi:MAG: hypothetical protein ACJ8CN_01535 [Gemmatimonadales bacterium]|jgi:hypothetical protein